MLAFIALLALPALATAYPQILPSGSGAGNFQYQQVSNFGNCVQQQWAGGQQIHCLPQTFQGVQGNQGNCNQDLYNQLQGFSNEISYCNPQLNGNGQFQYQSVNNYGNCLQQELRGGASIDCLPSAFPASSVGCTQNIFGQLQAFNNELPVCGQGYVSQQGFQGFGFPSQGGVTTGPGFGSTGSGFGGNQGFGGQGGWRGVPNYRRCMLAQQNANNVYGLCLPNQIADTEVCSQETYNQLQSFKETITQCDDSLGSAPFSGVEGHLNCLQEEQRGGVSALCLPNQIVDSESCSEETFGRLKEFRTQITECSNANGSPAGTFGNQY